MLGACGGLLGLGYALRSIIGEPRLNSMSNWVAHADGPAFGGATSMDMSMYMEMFMRHNEIRRTVEEIPGGVRTTTESDSPDLAALLHEHVPSMYSHLDQGGEIMCMSQSPARDRFRDRESDAIDHGDKLALDELHLFRKDVGTFLRQYDFLSQIVNYEDLSLEKLSIYLRHLAPVITSEALNHEIDLSTVDFDFLTQHRGETASGKLTGDVPLGPAKESGTGTAKDAELVALDEVIAQINDLFSGDHPDSSVRNVVTHIRDRLEESETLQQQAHNNSLAQFSASPDLHNEFVGAVIGAMDSSEDLSTQILNNSEIAQKLLGELVPIVYRALKETA